MRDPIDVLYIAGIGRSGSTLLERVLGAMPGFEAIGEMRHVFQRGFVENLLCACGQAFHECQHWKEVLRHAGLTCHASYDALAARARRLDRTRNIPALIGVLPARASFARDLHRHRHTLARLYSSLAFAAEGRVLVDGSKEASYAYLLTGIAEIRLHVVHLVRDPRAVAYSWTRKKRRPDVATRVAYMKRLPPRTTAWRWLYQNLSAHGLARFAASYQRIRYEDFVANPSLQLDTIRRMLGGEHPPFRCVDGPSVEVTSSHAVSGNPDRWTSGTVKVRLDDEWRHALPRRDQRIVQAMTLPLFHAYGYE